MLMCGVDSSVAASRSPVRGAGWRRGGVEALLWSPGCGAGRFGADDSSCQSLGSAGRVRHVTYNQLRFCLDFGCLPGILMAGVSEVIRGGMGILMGRAVCRG